MAGSVSNALEMQSSFTMNREFQGKSSTFQQGVLACLLHLQPGQLLMTSTSREAMTRTIPSIIRTELLRYNRLYLHSRSANVGVPSRLGSIGLSPAAVPHV